MSFPGLVSDHLIRPASYTIDQQAIEIPSDVRAGQAAFIRPGEMQVESWYPIEFVAGPTLADLRDEAEGLPLTKPTAIFVSKEMRVSLLKDPNFEVRTKSKALQETGADNAASWQWDIRPHVEGAHTLIAQVDVLRRRHDGRAEVFNQYSRRISVHVEVGTFQGLLNGIRSAETLGEALETLFSSWRGAVVALSTLTAAVFGLYWLIRKRGRENTVTLD